MCSLGRLAQVNVSFSFAHKFTHMKDHAMHPVNAALAGSLRYKLYFTNEMLLKAAAGKADRKLLAHAQQLLVVHQLCEVCHH